MASSPEMVLQSVTVNREQSSARENAAFVGDSSDSAQSTHRSELSISADRDANQLPKATEENEEKVTKAPLLRTLARNVCGSNYEVRLRWTVYVAMFVLYNAYLATGIALTYSTCPTWCNGIRLLLVITCIVYLGIVLSFCKTFIKKIIGKVAEILQPITSKPQSKCICWVAIWIILAVFVLVDSGVSQLRLRSFGGVFIIVLLGWLISKDRTKVNWRQVQCSLLFQFIMGITALRVDVGREVLNCLGDKVSTFLAFARHGAKFVFGYLVDGHIVSEGNKFDFGGVFFFHVLPVIFFFAFFVEILYFYGIMQKIVMTFGRFLKFMIGTTATESVSASANIFLGMTEAPMMIKPFFPSMTRSELHAVLTGGFSTVSGSVMAAYIAFGIPPQHLLTASFMSAPAALGMAKLLYPEHEQSKTDMNAIKVIKSEARCVLEAAAKGASDALSIVGNVAANLICFLAALAFLNSILDFLATAVGIEGLTLEILFGYTFTPIAFILGVPMRDCPAAGELLGLKTFANEFIAYKKLADIKDSLHERTVVLSTYALCGFSNLGSVGILLGASIAMCPQRASDFAELIIRALVGGTAACLLTACVAGSLIAD